MGLEERIDALKAKHRELEDAIGEYSNRSYRDDLEIASLKKQKLRIKDELAGLGRE